MVYFTERIDGENLRVRLIRPTEKGFVEKGSFIVTDKPSDADERWVCPAVLEGRLFVRWGKMYCYDLRADPPWVGARNDGRGVYATASPPIRWSMKRNLAHSGALPAAGGSAPVASGSNVFVTVAPHTLLCLKSDDGAVVWSKPHAAKDAGLDFADAVPAAGAAFPTPVVAKNAVFAWFPNGVAAAYDMLGTRLWAARVAPSDRPSSPMLCRDLLVVPGKALTALNASTGKEAWSRAESAASAPVYVYANGGPALLTGGGALLGLWDGKELAKGILGKGGPFLLTADARESLVYAAEADGKKFDVKAVVLPKKEGENAKEVWSVTVKGSAPATAPLLFDGSLYLVGADRELLALDAKTGDVTGRLALDPDNASNADVEPHLVVAGRRLYVHNVGRANETVVVEPGPKPAILWRYGAEAAVTASGFHKDTQWIRSGASLWALAGKTPAEPVEPKLSVVEAQAFLSDADGKAPILPFTDKAVPTNWLFAGPCYPSTTMTNFLSRLGPIETVAPTDGLSVRAGYTTITFHFARTNDVWQMGKLLAFELTAQTSRKAGTIYAYTIVENDRDRYVEYNPLNPGQYWRDFGKSLAANTWLSGQQVDQGSVFLLKKGRHGLLIQAAVEKPENAWGKIFMTPHLLDVDESIRAKAEQYAKDKTFWTEYAKTKDEPIVLPTFLK
jgi:outer membrane protein assembly factor BamB